MTASPTSCATAIACFAHGDRLVVAACQHQLLAEGREHLRPRRARLRRHEPYGFAAVLEDVRPRLRRASRDSGRNVRATAPRRRDPRPDRPRRARRGRSRARGRCSPTSPPASPRSAACRCGAFPCVRAASGTCAHSVSTCSACSRRVAVRVDLLGGTRGVERGDAAHAARRAPRPSDTRAARRAAPRRRRTSRALRQSASATRVCSATRSPGRRSSSTASRTSACRNRYSSPSASVTRRFWATASRRPASSSSGGMTGRRLEEPVVGRTPDDGRAAQHAAARRRRARRRGRARCRATSRACEG